MNVRKSHPGLKLAIILAVLVFAFNVAYCFAHDDDNRPERLVTMAVEFPGIQVPPDEEISMDIIFYNKGKSDENVEVRVAEKPEGWKTRIKTYRFDVSGVHVKSGSDKTLTFEADPGKDVKPGTYEFKIEANTDDGVFAMAETLVVAIREKDEGEKEDRGVKLTTSYPMLRGPSDGKFEFSVDVESKLDKDAIFDLSAKGPDGWEINFKPAYESKFISSLRLKAGQNSTVAVEVKPGLNAKEGEYPINVRVGFGDAKGEAELTVTLTGTYELEAGTASELLSLDAWQGEPANISFYIRNNGSAANNGIKFMSFKPENWKVEFKPEIVDSLEPGKLTEVELVITPHKEALVGDYMVNVRIEGEKATENLEFRVSVKASSAWAWIGIAIIVLVILGLTALFGKMGRR